LSSIVAITRGARSKTPKDNGPGPRVITSDAIYRGAACCHSRSSSAVFIARRLGIDGQQMTGKAIAGRRCATLFRQFRDQSLPALANLAKPLV
jgi:hypothetical protein